MKTQKVDCMFITQYIQWFIIHRTECKQAGNLEALKIYPLSSVWLEISHEEMNPLFYHIVIAFAVTLLDVIIPVWES